MLISMVISCKKLPSYLRQLCVSKRFIFEFQHSGETGEKVVLDVELEAIS